MVRRFLSRRVMMAALVAIAASLCPLSKADAQGTDDAAAKRKVEKFLGPDSHGKATINFVDLNGDGTPEAIVIRSGLDDCGSHGCAANVLDLHGPAAKDIGDFIAFGLQLLSSQTRGWRDITLVGNGKNATLRFNGQVYSVATAPAAAPASSAATAAATASATGWEFNSFSGPERLVGDSPRVGNAQAQVSLLCQPKPRSTQLRIDPGKDDPSYQEGRKFRFVIEIQNASGHVQKFPMVAENFGPDGGSQFYSQDFLSAPFLDALGQEGGVLRWRTDKGAELASWPLIGTAAGREMVRKTCKL
jgi:hypothetical protein